MHQNITYTTSDGIALDINLHGYVYMALTQMAISWVYNDQINRVVHLTEIDYFAAKLTSESNGILFSYMYGSSFTDLRVLKLNSNNRHFCN